MKPLLIAATTLALSGAAYAQTATEDAAKATEEAAQATQDAAQATSEAASETATEAGNAAADAAHDAAKAADEAAQAADAAATTAPATDMTATAPVETVAAPDVKAPMISEANPGLTSSWLTGRQIYTTNQPSSTAWTDTAMTERPADWENIAKVNDVVLDAEGNLIGYMADIGGFLGMGAKTVLLGKDALHLVHLENDHFFATNYTKEELEALPDFDTKTVLK
ncbi:MAG: PRC-barrel domain-containing protein [Paracoccus sp. (in: a-proteobacteria)]|nr:PRC-barrel domain-containing protein [Paracoccus sp. (in: a-proteobacteria)]